MNWSEIPTYYPMVTKRLHENDLFGAEIPELIVFLEDNGVRIEVNKIDEYEEEEEYDETFLTEDEAMDAAIISGFRFLEEKFTAQDDLLKKIAN